MKETTSVLSSSLQAWRGYHGNVYFEPMHIVKVGADKDGVAEGTQKATPSIASHKSGGSRRRTATAASQSQALVPVDNEEERQSVVGSDLSQNTYEGSRFYGKTYYRSKLSFFSKNC